MLRRGLFFGIFFVLGLAGQVNAQPVEFPLSGGQEVPPVTTDATGHCEASLNHSQTEYDIECTHNVVDQFLIGGSNQHIHNAASGVNGPIIFFFDAGTTINAVVNESTLSSMGNPQAPRTMSEFVAQLNSGNLYVNVHSTDNPSGEIRGQIPPPPSLFFAQFGNGGGLTSDIVLLNSASTGDPITASVNLLDPDGNPLDVGFEPISPLLSLGLGGGSEVSIDPLSSVTLRTDGQGDRARNSTRFL